MSEVNEYVEAEFENIERLLHELPKPDCLGGLSNLELSGTAALLHGFYNGVENVLKCVITAKGLPLPVGDSWHRDLIALSIDEGVILRATAHRLKGYLAFRHFFSHAYSFDIDRERIIPLVADAPESLSAFKADIERALR